jgi:cell division protein FtsI (penicillin-binding protein 3)
MDVKNEVLYRVYFLLFGIVVPASILLLYKTVQIAYVEGEQWREKGQKNYLEYRAVEADRGNIYSADGSLMATSIPYFDLFFDPKTPSDEHFAKYLDTMAHCLATYVLEDYTVGGARDYLLFLRSDENKSRHITLKRKASFAEKKFIESFPLFRLGQYRGGLIAKKASERKRPFGLLAQRTIGYVRDEVQPVGLEGHFNEDLGGEPGQTLMVCVDPAADLWMPLDDLTVIEPESGSDVVTTINIDIQEITQEALLRAMNLHDAEWGTAIVMEVETGAIRAIANLGRTETGWWETYNYAIGTRIEPGSTFKTASMMAMLEDGYIKLDDSISIENGRTTYYDRVMEDASPYSARLDTIQVREAFEISSNVGISKMVQEHYGEKAKGNNNEAAAHFVKRLKSFNLHQPTGIEIPGEANPYIKEAYSAKDDWSGTTLPWMSIGYEVEMTPLQLLAFYNAIANDGKMMKPHLVSEIQRFGKTIQRFPPSVISRRIASRETIALTQELLESVVESPRGTAYKFRSERYRFAGKTGTALVDYRRGERGRSVGGYQASFAGYFPADKPRYSVVVVINKPRRGSYYGSDVAGPVFREIADNIFTVVADMHSPLNQAAKPVLAVDQLPRPSIGGREDMEKVMAYLGMKPYGRPDTEFAVLMPRGDSLLLEQRTLPESAVPNVVGMGLRDAVYVLENRGLQVQVEGFGKVARQSILPGTRARGQQIRLYLR